MQYAETWKNDESELVTAGHSSWALYTHSSVFSVEVLYLKMTGNEWFSRYMQLRVRDHTYSQTHSENV
jgi:hypothetical protein